LVAAQPQHNLALVEEVKTIAVAKGVTPGQIALAWLLAQQPWIVPIPGTTKVHRLEENLAADDVTRNEAELAQLDDLSSRVEIHGGHYPDFLEAQTNL
jgi:aryl-alcohol dehydrogenase-like predicted oxidoreductase